MPPLASQQSGQAYWRSVEHAAGSARIDALLADEFAHYDPDELAGMPRRRFLKLMAASMALAGLTLTGCRRWPQEQLAPYTHRPDGRLPGRAERYATVMELAGVGAGVLATSYDGRPIKIEGNPQHPYSLGATSSLAQASVLDLYDPARSRTPMRRGADGQQMTQRWSDALAALTAHFESLREGNGEGFVVLSEASSSLATAALRDRLEQSLPAMRWLEYEPLGRDNELAGADSAFGQIVRTHLHLDRAQIIVSLEADLLAGHPASLRYARDWAAGRRAADGIAGQQRMNRMYAFESAYSLTGASADMRVPIPSATIASVAQAVLSMLRTGAYPSFASALFSAYEHVALRQTVDALVRDLQAHRGRSVVVAGAGQPGEVHALAHVINHELGNFGSTVTFTPEPHADRLSHAGAIMDLSRLMKAGKVSTLLMLGGNPVYDAPADADFAGALAAIPTSIHLSLYNNETSQRCAWHVPRAHYLECWSDARAWDGTATVGQPLIQPLFEGRSVVQMLDLVRGEAESDGLATVRDAYADLIGRANFEHDWRQALHDGVVSGTALKPVTPRLIIENVNTGALRDVGDELTFQRDARVYDGRFANNGWLQELPDPLTKLTWDNALLMSVRQAGEMGVNTGDMVRIDTATGSAAIPVYVMPGQAYGSVALAVGYGRTGAGPVGDGVGFNAYVLRSSDALRGFTRADITPLPRRKHRLAMTQDHHLIDAVGFAGRKKRIGEKGAPGKIIHEGTFEQYVANPSSVHYDEHGDFNLQLWEPPHAFNDPHAWGMTIDMNACMGCGACVVSCKAENNIPIVGKDQVLMGREMHWLRIDRYFKGSPTDPNPQVVHQPMMCVHCENAPCEQVCPVAATVHDTEGLNTMVYNRCIGTRYCSNNCPYKVRRFNYFDYHSKMAKQAAEPWLGFPDTQQAHQVNDLTKMVFNPEVTVRMRGVMEKCSYCVQRIADAKRAARNDFTLGRRDSELLRDGEVVTACQSACPTQAIVFGNLNDPTSEVHRLQRRNPRAYKVLEDLNTRPRKPHLAKLRNPAAGAADEPVRADDPSHEQAT